MTDSEAGARPQSRRATARPRLFARAWQFFLWALWRPGLPHTRGPAWPDLPPGPYGGLPIALDTTRQALDRQNSDADAIDTKAGLILASASLLVTVLTIWHMPDSSVICIAGYCAAPGWAQSLVRITAWLIFPVALVVYGLVIYFAGRAYSLRDFNFPPAPSQFVTLYKRDSGDSIYPIAMPEGELQLSLFQGMIAAYAHNTREIDEKVQWLKRALFMFWIEAVFVALILVYETIIAGHVG